MADRAYLDVSEEAVISLLQRNVAGPVVMLNLLRFRDVADYSDAPELAPETAISGAEAYALYAAHTTPILEASGGRVLFSGTASGYLIGPSDEVWDHALLVEQRSLQDFLSFAQNPDIQAGLGHRRAALSDSRLLPLVPSTK